MDFKLDTAEQKAPSSLKAVMNSTDTGRFLYHQVASGMKESVLEGNLKFKKVKDESESTWNTKRVGRWISKD